MKKRLITFVLIACMMALMSVSVFAAAPTTGGIYNVQASGATVKALDADGNTVKATTGVEIDGATYNDFYADAVKLEVTVSDAKDGDYYLVIAQTDDEVPTEDNIVYIDQTTAADGKAVFTVYPNGLDSKVTYHVFVSSTSGARTEILSFNYYQAYTLGDADSNDLVELNDAIVIMRYLVDLETFDEKQKLAANVDGVEGISLNDAVVIMRYLVGLDELVG